MVKGNDMILLVLGKRPEGLSVSDIHLIVAACELRALREPRLRHYLTFTFLPSHHGVYSPEVAIALSEMLRDGLIRPAVGNRLVLTEKGQQTANQVLAGLLGQSLRDIHIDEGVKGFINRELVHLEAINLDRTGRVGRIGNPNLSSAKHKKLRGPLNAQVTKAGGKADLVAAGAH